jgi:hypothetical protein
MPEGKHSIYRIPVQKVVSRCFLAHYSTLYIFVVVFRGLWSRIHHLQHRHESQKSSGLIDGETLDLAIQNVWLD